MNLRNYMGFGDDIRGRYGIEVEVEGDRLPDLEGVWTTDIDGSLRNGREYILSSPLDLGAALTAFSNLRHKMQDAEAEVDFSFRTSIHVHMNCLDLNAEQVKQLVYTCLLLEPVILAFAGEERKHNRFCLSVKDADGALPQIEEFFSQEYRKRNSFPSRIKRFGEQEHKYSAVNLASLPTKGSLEIRSMRGTFSQGVMTAYLSGLDSLYEYATRAESVFGIFSEFNELGPSKFVQKVLGEWAVYFSYPEVEADLQLQSSILISLPYRNCNGN